MGPKLYHKVTIFFGPHVANFLAKPSSNFFHYPCFTCYRTATWNLHFFCDTLLHPSMWITLVYPSLHVSGFTSPSSTFICHLAFVHPPWASSGKVVNVLREPELIQDLHLLFGNLGLRHWDFKAFGPRWSRTAWLPDGLECKPNWCFQNQHPDFRFRMTHAFRKETLHRPSEDCGWCQNARRQLCGLDSGQLGRIWREWAVFFSVWEREKESKREK